LTQPFDLVVTGPAARSIQESLPEAVAAAVIDLHQGPLPAELRRVGTARHRELNGLWSARRGAYRIVHRIDDARHEVVVLRVGHRADIYRAG